MSNIEKIKDMVTGKYNGNIQVGYEGKTIQQRKEGEEWTDARGRRWTIQKMVKENRLLKYHQEDFDKCMIVKRSY